MSGPHPDRTVYPRADRAAAVPASESLERRLLLAAPKVVAAQFEFETGHAVSYVFDQNVGKSIDPHDLAIVNNNGEVILGGEISAAYDEKTNTATFTFPGKPEGLLADGNYRAILSSAGVTNELGESVERDHEFKFRFLRGDANGDAKVDLADFNIFARNFGRPGTFSGGDFNYDGKINLADFGVFEQQFGNSIL